jgi:hypothetical protein
MRRKTERFLFPLVLLFVIPMLAQVEHAPTPEQCRADGDAWDIPKWSSSVPNEGAFADFATAVLRDPRLSAKTLDARNAELEQCEKTDSTQFGRYAQAARAYTSAELVRMACFILRHNLKEQFYQEDEQGKR